MSVETVASPRQGGVRGRSKSQARPSPSIAANAVSSQRPAPASGHGSASREKNPTARVSSGCPWSSPPMHPTVEQDGVHRQPGEAETQAVEAGDERLHLDLDARLLVDLLHRDLGRRVADVGPADRVEPHPRVGPLGEQDLRVGVGDDRRDRDLRGDVPGDALADRRQPLVEQRVGLGLLDRRGPDVGRDLEHLLEALLLVEALGEAEPGAGDGRQRLGPTQEVDGRDGMRRLDRARVWGSGTAGSGVIRGDAIGVAEARTRW